MAPFELAASLQERNTNSRNFGNFRWSIAQANLVDRRAVDFCMQSAAIFWLNHRDHMPP